MLKIQALHGGTIVPVDTVSWKISQGESVCSVSWSLIRQFFPTIFPESEGLVRITPEPITFTLGRNNTAGKHFS